MQSVEEALIFFFEQAAKKESALLEMLANNPSFSIEQDCWCFTLPDLYVFLQSQEDRYANLDYNQFRKLIFNSPINQTVRSHGAEITIKNNQTNVDKSCYALVWRN